MTLHVLQEAHETFIRDCFVYRGFSVADASRHASDIVDVAGAYEYPVFFVGPDSVSPKYFLGAYVDVNRRAILEVNAFDIAGTALVKDATDWLKYMFDDLGVQLLEACVWVEDLQKEWFLRAMGFKKAGVVPDRIDVPGRGAQTGLMMYCRPAEFEKVTKETFRTAIRKYKQHRDRLAQMRAA